MWVYFVFSIFILGYPSQNIGNKVHFYTFFIQQVIAVVHSNIIWFQFLNLIIITNFQIKNIQLIRNVLCTSIAVVYILTSSSKRCTLNIKKGT